MWGSGRRISVLVFVVLGTATVAWRLPSSSSTTRVKAESLHRSPQKPVGKAAIFIERLVGRTEKRGRQPAAPDPPATDIGKKPIKDDIHHVVVETTYFLLPFIAVYTILMVFKYGF